MLTNIFREGHLSNDVLRLEGGDHVSNLVRPLVDFVMVKRIGVHLEWDKLMKGNIHSELDLYELEDEPFALVSIRNLF
ncbi:unnamed protein product [Prunus armeniaca]